MLQRLRKELEAEETARAASQERKRVEAERNRKEKDNLKSEAKRERRQLRSLLIDRYTYFVSNIDGGLSTEKAGVLADMDLLCHRMTNAQ